ncbi:hypothetical protein [Weissella cibaria]|uniref:hypothetical protein n=1 Tax=Weissella cibaria TaxID=137591 RepID=UPI001C1F7352|nr:hypothetical protein [Weissella cibaria]MBU7543591.1 hypothetical protein [Weissella cibaria]MCV3316823.1 hypothetical protein [Weissella cibaria]
MNKKTVLQHLLVILLFVVIAGLSVVPYWNRGTIYGQGDLLFHLNRLAGLTQGVQAHEIPYRYFNVLTNIGSASNFFYPFVYMLGWSGLFAVMHNPIHAFYLGEAIVMFVTLTVAYLAMNQYQSQRMRSIIFALLYGFASYRTYLAYDQFVFGEMLAFAFLPLGFVGLYNVFLGDARNWRALAAGLTLILYAHMLSTVLTLALFVIIVILLVLTRRLQLEKIRVLNFIKAVLMTVVMTSVIYLPFLYQNRQTTIITTVQGPISKMYDLGQSLVYSLNGLNQNIGLVGVLAIVIGAVQLWRRRFSRELAIWGIGVVLFIMASSIFPWRALSENVQALVQFPFRLLGLSSLFLLVYLSGELVRVFALPRQQVLTTLVVLLFSAGSYLAFTENLIYTRQHQQPLVTNQRFEATTALFETSFTATDKQLAALNKPGARHDYIGMLDYAPKNAWPVENYYSFLAHQTFLGNQQIKAKATYRLTSATFKVDAPRSGQLNVPILMYGNERVMLDGHRVTAKQTKRGSIGVHVTAGEHRLTVSYKTPKWIYQIWLLSAIGWLILFVTSWHRRKAK